MSAAVEDRLLDYALHALYREEAPDLTERVVEAWERGERGSDLSVLEAQPERPRPTRSSPPPLRPSPRRRWLLTAAAAGLVAAAGATVWLVRHRPREPGAVWTASATAPVTAVRDGEVLQTSELRAGDVVALPTGVALAFADGTRLANVAAAVVALDPRELELLRGEVELDSAGETSIDLGAARATVSAGTLAHFELALPDERALAGELDAARLQVLRRAREGAVSARIAVRRGGLALRHRGGSERLVAGTKRELWRAVASVEPDLDGEKKVRGWLADFAGGPAMLEKVDLQAVQAYFATHPARWGTLRDALAEQARRFEIREPAFRMVLQLALEHPTGDGLPFLRELWLVHPEGFGDLEIAALAERGQFEFEREARAMVAQPLPGRPATFAAAWLARQGDAPAAAALERELRELQARNPDELLRLAYGAYALEESGHAGAWTRALEPARAAIETHLRAGRLDLASYSLGILRALDDALAEGRSVPIEMLMAIRFSSGAAYGDAASVRAGLATLGRPR